MGAYDTTLGALLLGAFLNTYLYGLSTFQYGSYWNTDFNDPLYIKAVVLSMFLVDTAHSASIIYLAWAYTVSNFDNPDFLNAFVWPLPACTFVIALTAFGVQNFLALRIHRIMRIKWVLYAFVVSSTAAVILGIVCGVRNSMLRSISGVASLRTLLTIWLTLEVLIDVCIATVLFTVLQRSRTGFKRSDAALNRLARSAIQSGVFTTILATIALVCFSASKDTLFYLTFGIPCARAYVISLMDTLLCRKDVRDIMNDPVIEDTFKMPSMPDIVVRSPGSTTHVNGTVHIRREVHTEVSMPRFEVEGSHSRISSEDNKAPSLVLEIR